MITKFGIKKLETLLYQLVQNAFPYLEPFRCGSQDDRQTDRENLCQQQRGLTTRVKSLL